VRRKNPRRDGGDRLLFLDAPGAAAIKRGFSFKIVGMKDQPSAADDFAQMFQLEQVAAERRARDAELPLQAGIRQAPAAAKHPHDRAVTLLNNHGEIVP
jgi:hypothetical protein